MKKTINYLFGIFCVIIILSGFFAGILSVGPIRASSIIIAASNSSSTWKSEAAAVCTGTSDQNIINSYLTVGNTVELSPGTFNINGIILPASSTHLYGQGNTTLFNFSNAAIDINNVSNVELNAFKISGTINKSTGAAVFIGVSSENQSGFLIHDISCTATGSNDFYAYVVGNLTLSNLVYSNVDANTPDGMGFMLSGEGTTPGIQNITYYHCTVENAGVASTRLLSDGVSWTTGFDFAEYGGLTINHLQTINCSVNGAWESDFHIEDAPTKQDVIITGCNATNAGQKPSPTYGYGFVSNTGDVIFYNNTTSSNIGGDLCLDGTVYTPIINGISPANSTKTASAVNQGNCSGVIVNTDATHKELVLYSNNGNVVNQQIELGNYYKADDNGKYSFNGTNIVAQFTDYTVIRLVQTTPPTITNTSISTLPVKTITTSTTVPLIKTTVSTTVKTTSAQVPSSIQIIAAANSDISWKSKATAICFGTNDQNTINMYLKTGSTVELAPGTFNIGGNLTPLNNTHMFGQGNITILNFNNSSIYVNDVSNVELNGFKITGTINPAYGAGIFIIAASANQSGFSIHDISCTATGSNDFYAYVVGNLTLSNLVYSNLDANTPDGMGFMLSGEGTTPTIQNVTYYHCTVENAGIAKTRINDWVTGFDFCGYSGLTINGLSVIKCSVNGAWESDFYFEDAAIKENAILTGCNAQNAGKKMPSPIFGYGFVSNTGDVIFSGNTASNNTNGDLCLDGTPYASIINGISPANSIKNVATVNQGNCSGAIVNTDATRKELVLYSNDGKAVDQQIELGNYYSADDGGSYGFTGTKIIVQFTNYAVIRLVKTAPPIVTRPVWDINGDHVCSIGDLVLIGLHWGETGTPGWMPEDVNADGVIDIQDIEIIYMHFGQTW